LGTTLDLFDAFSAWLISGSTSPSSCLAVQSFLFFPS
jgi:hypothetical protein